jgi:hypothetical protein
MSSATEAFTVTSHFEGKAPVVLQIYKQVLKSLRQFGPVIEEPKKTSIHLVNATAAAGVATRKEYLILTLKSDRKLTSPRIHKSEQTSAKRFHHEVKLSSPADVDAELAGWLREAYELSAKSA